MIKITNKLLCCGCSACVQKCPTQCISLREDSEGFCYPIADDSKCIHCGMCIKICPFNQKQHKTRMPVSVKSFAVKNHKPEIRRKSSSGGTFLALAKLVIERGGVVFGAIYNSQWEVCITGSENIDSVYRMMGSKYVQARVGDSYRKAEDFLKQGREVLFSGTPCQITGLRSFLQKDYPNLLTVDVLCHGVPSPGIWRRYLSEVIAHCNCSFKDISGITFRSKKSPYTWQQYGIEIYTSEEKVLFSEMYQQNIYMHGFIDNLILRPSCYRCMQKKRKLHGDITLGDFWGIHMLLPEFEDSLGVGLVLASSTKGVEFLNKLNIEKHEISLDSVVRMNAGFDAHIIPHPHRRRFFKEIQDETCSVSKAMEQSLQLSMFTRLFHIARWKLEHLIYN